MEHRFGVWIAFALFAMAPAAHAQSVRVIKLSEGQAFHMGKVTSTRVVQPDVGAKRLTLNFSVSQDGREFSQHVHDYSDDTILIPRGRRTSGRVTPAGPFMRANVRSCRPGRSTAPSRRAQ